MSTIGTNIGLNSAWGLGYNGWAAENDKNLRGLDVLVQANAIAMQTAPPASPADGDTYIVATGARGAWAPYPNAVARRFQVDNAAASLWEFWFPKIGWKVSVAGTTYEWNGTAWTADLKVGGKLVVNGSDRILSDGSGIFSSLYSSALAQNAIPRSSNASGLLAAGSWIDTGSALSTSNPVALSGSFLQMTVGAASANAGAILFKDGGGVPNGLIGWDANTESVRLVFQNTASSGKIVLKTRISGTIGDRFWIDTDGSGNFAGKLIVAAATASAPSINIPSGTAPSSPAAGDVWRDANGFNFQGGIRVSGFGAGFVRSSASGILSASALTSSDVTTALGFTPINRAGDTKITGTLVSSAGMRAASFTGMRVAYTDIMYANFTLDNTITADVISIQNGITITLGAGYGAGNSGIVIRLINASSSAATILIPSGISLIHAGNNLSNTTISLPAYSTADLCWGTNGWSW